MLFYLISSKIILPINEIAFGLMMPLGNRWKSYSFPSTTTVWPALFPPYNRKKHHKINGLMLPTSTLSRWFDKIIFFYLYIHVLGHCFRHPTVSWAAVGLWKGQEGTTESRQNWGRARINRGVLAEAWRELKVSGNKTGLKCRPWSPISDMPTQAHPFWSSSVHGHFFGLKPTTSNISPWTEALPTCPPTPIPASLGVPDGMSVHSWEHVPSLQLHRISLPRDDLPS